MEEERLEKLREKTAALVKDYYIPEIVGRMQSYFLGKIEEEQSVKGLMTIVGNIGNFTGDDTESPFDRLLYAIYSGSIETDFKEIGVKQAIKVKYRRTYKSLSDAFVDFKEQTKLSNREIAYACRVSFRALQRLSNNDRPKGYPDRVSRRQEQCDEAVKKRFLDGFRITPSEKMETLRKLPYNH